MTDPRARTKLGYTIDLNSLNARAGICTVGHSTGWTTYSKRQCDPVVVVLVTMIFTFIALDWAVSIGVIILSI